MSSRETLLELTEVSKDFPVHKGGLVRRNAGTVKAVDSVSLSIAAGETVGLVGESGCGKTTLGRLVVRLLSPTSGRILFAGHSIGHLSARQLRPIRGDLQMVFQDPYSSLNPRRSVGSIVAAPLRFQPGQRTKNIKPAAQELLELVGLSPEHYERFPHEFSGGQRQRIGIARALATRPKLIVADEPVSALDVSIRAQVTNLLEDLQRELGLTYLLIAHDLTTLSRMSNRIAVMYLGQLVEIVPRERLLTAAAHPYTLALLSAVPVLEPRTAQSDTWRSRRIRLVGDVPSPLQPPPACRFHTRCWKAREVCRTVDPPVIELAPGHQVACHFPATVAGSARQSVTTRIEGVAQPVADQVAGHDG